MQSRSYRLLPRKVLQWLEYHRSEPDVAVEFDPHDTQTRCIQVSSWDERFISVDQETLFELVLAARYLDIKYLLYACNIGNIHRYLLANIVSEISGVGRLQIR